MGYEYLEKWEPHDFAGQIVWCLTGLSVSVVIAGNQRIFYAKFTFLGNVNLTDDADLLNKKKGVYK